MLSDLSPTAVVVDPSARGLERLVSLLESLGFRVFGNTDIVDGLINMLQSPIDLAVLADELLARDVESVFGILRLFPSVPIIIVIGKGDLSVEINAFERGADAYLHRTSSDAIFLARIKALHRRNRRQLARTRKSCPASDWSLSLSLVERQLLGSLLRADRKIVPPEDLFQEVWDGRSNYESLKFHLRRLRGKLAGSPCGIRLMNVHGKGHRIFHQNDDVYRSEN